MSKHKKQYIDLTDVEIQYNDHIVHWGILDDGTEYGEEGYCDMEGKNYIVQWTQKRGDKIVLHFKEAVVDKFLEKAIAEESVELSETN